MWDFQFACAVAVFIFLYISVNNFLKHVLTSKLPNLQKVISNEIIDVDLEEDDAEVLHFEGKGKGKVLQSSH